MVHHKSLCGMLIISARDLANTKGKILDTNRAVSFSLGIMCIVEWSGDLAWWLLCAVDKLFGTSARYAEISLRFNIKATHLCCVHLQPLLEALMLSIMMNLDLDTSRYNDGKASMANVL